MGQTGGSEDDEMRPQLKTKNLVVCTQQQPSNPLSFESVDYNTYFEHAFRTEFRSSNTAEML